MATVMSSVRFMSLRDGRAGKVGACTDALAAERPGTLSTRALSHSPVQVAVDRVLVADLQLRREARGVGRPIARGERDERAGERGERVSKQALRLRTVL